MMSADLRETLTHLPNVEERLNEYRRHVLTTPITPLRRLNPNVDRELADIIEHCLDPNPQQRYHHIAEIATDLRRRREHWPLRCHRRRAPYVLKKFLRRNLGMVVITIAAIISLGIASATFYILGTAKMEGLRSDLDEAQRLKIQAEEDRDQVRQEAQKRQAELMEDIRRLKGESE